MARARRPKRRRSQPTATLPKAPKVLRRRRNKSKRSRPSRPPRAPTAPSITAPSTQSSPNFSAPTVAPTLPGAQGLRIAGDTALSQARGNRNAGVYQAALNYGDPETIAQWANMGFGPSITNNPSSALSIIGKQEKEGLKTIDQGHNAQNTFFSGLRLEDVGKTRSSATDARAQALADYQTAVRELDALLAEAHSERDSAHSEADQMEWDAFMQSEPEAYGIAPTSSPSGGGGGSSRTVAAPIPTHGRQQRRGGDVRRRVRKPKKRNKKRR